jgi:hypothetical protein
MFTLCVMPRVCGGPATSTIRGLSVTLTSVVIPNGVCGSFGQSQGRAAQFRSITGAVALPRRNLTAIAGVAIILLLILFSLPIAVEPRIKQRLVNALGERFDSEVQLEALTVSLLPRPRLSDRGLVLRHKDRTDVPPLVTIASFPGEADFVGLLSDPIRFEQHPSGGLGDQRPTRRSEPERRRAECPQ